MTAADVEEAEATVERIRARHRDSIIATGNDLRSIKDKLGHGKFGSWLAFHFSMSERTAQNYMNAAEVFGGTPMVVDALPPSTIYKLAAKAAPADIRRSVVSDIIAGASPDHRKVEARLVAAKKDERKARDDDRDLQKEMRAWQQRAEQMRAAQKSEDEIELERKRWETKAAHKERKKINTEAKAQLQHQQELDESEKQKRQAEEMNALAIRAVAILKKRLGPDFLKFRDIIALGPTLINGVHTRA